VINESAKLYTGYLVIYRDTILTIGRQIGHHTG